MEEITLNRKNPFETILYEMVMIHRNKNADYSQEGLFGNFKESEVIGIADYLGAFVRLQDKYTRACNLIKGRDPKVQNEKLEDTLIDLANYAVIVLALKKQKELEDE